VHLVCSGCFIGGGPVVGYGTQRGFHAGGAAGVGVDVAGGTGEVGGTNAGLLTSSGCTHESQLVFAPRAERASDICLR